MNLGQTISSRRPGAARFDILAVPGLSHFLLWKHSRTAVQIVLFALAAIMVVDGLMGSQLAARNTATVGAWVHYRGFIVLALLLAGNLFCAGCPFILPRKLARWIGKPTRRWPKVFRNKWLALAGLLGILFVYELYDLWSSPWLTAWVIVAYFVTAFVLEMLFTRDSFCMYVCPLGTFNFLYSTVSPLQITNRSMDVCKSCVGKDCINGRWDAQDNLIQQGCQLELYVPQLNSNMDCTLCLDCAKACPHDNVALVTRPPGDELFRQSWPNRLDLALLAIIAACVGLVNAFAMTPPVYQLEQWLAVALNTDQEVFVLGLIFITGAVLLPLALVYGGAWLNQRFVPGNRARSLARLIMRHAYAFVPLGFGIWASHYLFHLLIGPLTLIPALQTFFANVVGVPLLGEPNVLLGAAWVPPIAVIQGIQMLTMAAGIGGAWLVTWNAAARAHKDRNDRLREFLPWALILLLIGALAIWVFLLPMEMRGNVLA
ncbi:MAG: FesM [Caldilineaceae bacterium]|nr:FesM [Caldilineaceae bacterium]